MARVLMTAAYSDLEPWPGLLFEGIGAAIVTSTATQFVWQHPGSSEFPGFQVRISGAGFTYGLSDLPTGGTISAIRVYDASNNLVLTIDSFTGSGVPRDLAQIASDMLGGTNGEGPGPNGKMSWSHILQGNDKVIGTSGDDRQLQGFMDGNDRFDMKGGDDFIYCGAGNDTVSGGAGFDILAYDATAFNEGFSAFRGINANMANKTIVDCWGNTDRISGIEGIYGSRFNDTLIGSNAAEEEFAGLRGRDFINGGAGLDVVDYNSDRGQGGGRGITIDLETSISRGVVKGFAIDGFGQRDTLISIEDVRATEYDDRIIGSRYSNRLRGEEGDDTMTGGGGRDEFYWRAQEEIGSDDVITDFAVSGTSRDVLEFRTENFNNMTTTVSLVIDASPTTDEGTFIFNSGTSTLFWDEDGTGGISAVKIVTLTGVTSLTAANFDLF